MLASLEAMANDSAAASVVAFPTAHEATKFGDWVKAGVLKTGDKVSTLGSIKQLVEVGPTLEAALKLKAANDNGVETTAATSQIETNAAPLMVRSIKRLNAPVSLFNLEIESRPSEITNNYLVGEMMLWAHNHGNSLKSPRRTVIYKLICDGIFMKWGISSNLAKRYPKNGSIGTDATILKR